MKLLQSAAFLFLLMVFNNAIGQSLKITSVGSEDNVSFKVIEKQILGKKLELTLYNDSATVFYRGPASDRKNEADQPESIYANWQHR